MNTGPRTQAAFIQGNQSMMEHAAPHSAVLYLFQEVSKLASPIHHTFMDTHLTSTEPNKTSRQTPLIDTSEEEDAHLFDISSSSCHHTMSCLSPFEQMKKVKEEGDSSSVMSLTEPQPECKSTWKILSLINLQCERLLSPGNGENPSASSSFSKTDRLNDNTGSTAVDKMDQGDNSLHERNTEGVSPREVVCRRVCSDKSQGYVTDTQESCFQLQPAEKTDIFITEQEKSETPSSQANHRHYKSSGNIPLWLQHECQDWLSSKQDILNLSSTNARNETHADLTKAALTLDHNANITSDPQAAQPASHLINSSQNQLATDQKDKISETHPDCVSAPNPAATEPDPSHKNTETNSSQREPGSAHSVAPPTKQQWRIKTPRKQPHPSRSADIQDPDFQGVTFRMDTEFDDSKEQCRLLITSKYSRRLCRRVKKPRQRTRVVTKSLKTSSSDEENGPTTNSTKGKVCASCCTRKTPMWRDAEDGTPLCNACGIRYKKYRVRCVNCWHIPRKESSSSSRCLKCGNFVKLTSAQRKRRT